MELHIIFGPTAASKTKIAQDLWEKYHYPILSVDSRKVYTGADIGTNKLSILSFLSKNQTVLFGGIDFVSPDEKISVYDYQQYVYKWVETHFDEIKNAGGLIIHGGTGLYLDAILEGKSLLAKKNELLRAELEKFSLEELQIRAKKDNLEGYTKLNESDNKNPRRLIRVIENVGVENGPRFSSIAIEDIFYNSKKIWHIQLPKRDELAIKINERVFKYFEEGWIKEVEQLLKKYSLNAPALQMMGYKQLVNFMSTHSNYQDLIDENSPKFLEIVAEIQREHRRYSKRQETWAKKYIRNTEKV